MTVLAGYRAMTAAVAWLGVVASFEGWLSERRPLPPELKGGSRFVVTTSADGGPGSLREALFAADRAPTRARVEIRVDRIVLDAPLPPLVNPEGIVIDAPGGGCEIDARTLVTGSALDLAAPRCLVRGVRIRGAAGQGILVRSRGARLRGVGLFDCGDGVLLAEGADDLEVRDSTFAGNGSGVRLPAGATGVTLVGNQFRRHEQAGIWAVAAEPALAAPRAAVVVRGNRFEEDRIGAVLINVPVRLEGNTFVRSTEAAVFLTGSGIVRDNRVQDGLSLGILADVSRDAVIEDNELFQNLAVGILLRAARGTRVQRNKVYGNGYGIVTVLGDAGRPAIVADNQVMAQVQDGLFLVGDSPVLRGNHSLRNRGAGLRVLDLVPVRGRTTPSHPVLDGNVLQANGEDGPVRGEYRVTEREGDR